MAQASTAENNDDWMTFTGLWKECKEVPEKVRKDFGEWTWTWNSFKEKGKNTLVLMPLVSFLLSVWDVGTDTYQAFKYLLGDYYDRKVPSLNSSYYDESQCVSVSVSPDANDVDYYTIRCLEKDRTWAVMSFCIVFMVPGLSWGMSQLDKNERTFRSRKSRIVFGLLSTLFFPVMLILVKLVDIFGPGQQWEKLANFFESNEGVWESCSQLMLNLYIIFSSDRQVSTSQWVTIASSYGTMSLLRNLTGSVLR